MTLCIGYFFYFKILLQNGANPDEKLITPPMSLLIMSVLVGQEDDPAITEVR